MKPKESMVLNRALEQGVGDELMKAFKFTYTPTREELEQCLLLELGNAFDEWFDSADDVK